MTKDVFADPRTKQSDSLAHNAMVSLSQARKLLNEAAELRYRVTCEIEPDRTKLKSQFALDAIALYVRARNYDRAKIIARESAIIKHNLLDYCCSKCYGKGVWMEEVLTLELDHINGDSCDNRLENLRFLCPNCHSQTPTYKGKNSRGKKKTRK